MTHRPHWGIWLLLGSLWTGAAQAQEPDDPQFCPPEQSQVERTRYLRALSLDLRGHVPTPEEHATIAAQPDDAAVPEALIDDWLSSEAFIAQAVRRHRALLWNNISNLNIVSADHQINSRGGIWRTGRERRYRPSVDFRSGCADRPAEFTADGAIITAPDANEVEVEGWVEVNPYWAPESTIRVCAFDAQDRRFSASGSDCAGPRGRLDTACGCGPNLMWCRPGGDRSEVRAFGKSLELLIAKVLRDDASYLDLFSSRTSFVNGPMVHFYRHLAPVADAPFTPTPVDVETLPEIPFTDAETWAEISLPAGHAGVLTHPAYLLRFQTNRARANRFYEGFLCQPFQPPAAGLGAADAEQALNPDLQQRTGCAYCHALLEPAAAHWGRWAESGGGFLSPEDFPLRACEECIAENYECPDVCSARARNVPIYLTRAGIPQDAPFVGRLRTARFIRDDLMHAIDQGPAFMVRATVGDNRFPVCTARRTAEWLLGRQMSTEADAAWLDELAREFVQGGFKYRALVKTIVTDARYRGIR